MWLLTLLGDKWCSVSSPLGLVIISGCLPLIRITQPVFEPIPSSSTLFALASANCHAPDNNPRTRFEQAPTGLALKDASVVWHGMDYQVAELVQLWHLDQPQLSQVFFPNDFAF